MNPDMEMELAPGSEAAATAAATKLIQPEQEQQQQPLAAAIPPPQQTEQLPPNHTIYINNLNEKIKIEDLKKALYALMGQYGAVLDIVARKTLKSRGQAFVVFRDVSSAIAAVRTLQGKELFEKPMRVQFAKDKSDAISKLDGSFAERFKQRQEFKKIKKQEELKQKKLQAASKKRSVPDSASSKQSNTKKQQTTSGPTGTSSNISATDAPLLPNNILFVENLPGQCDETALSALFVQFPGFKEAKLVPTRQGLAFVEFENQVMAGVALNTLNGFKVDQDHPMKVTYAKR